MTARDSLVKEILDLLGPAGYSYKKAEDGLSQRSTEGGLDHCQGAPRGLPRA